MEKRSHPVGIRVLTRIIPILVGSTVALLLVLTVVRAQGAPNFDSSYKTGAWVANTGDTITYTIVTVNTGDPVSDVVLTDSIPIGANYVLNSCTYRRPGGSAQSCTPPDLWQENFSTDDRITTTFSVQVTAGTMQWPLVNCAYLDWDSSQKEMCFTTTVNPLLQYIPLIMHDYEPRPDLRVASLVVTPTTPIAGQPVTITVEVVNAGELAADPFWVDLYDNPDPPPDAANEPWNYQCSGSLQDCYGIAWYVDGGLDPGESVVLSSLGGYEAAQTHWPGHFVDSGNHDVYAFADSWNPSVWYGAVLEHNEDLDNRYGPVSTTVTANSIKEAGGKFEEPIDIPPRPIQPR